MASSPASPQRSSLEANATSYSNRPRGGGRRSLPIDNRPILLREPDPTADVRPERSELAQLLAGLTSRDVAILAALDDHRYLDQEQVRQFFFDGQRHLQIRTKWLRDQHLIQRWTALQPPGWHRLHSILLNSVRGARVREAAEICLHGIRSNDASPMVAQASANQVLLVAPTLARELQLQRLLRKLADDERECCRCEYTTLWPRPN